MATRRTLRKSNGQFNGSTGGWGKRVKRSAPKGKKVSKPPKIDFRKGNQLTITKARRKERRKGALGGALIGTIVLGPGVGTALGAYGGNRYVRATQFDRARPSAGKKVG